MATTSEVANQFSGNFDAGNGLQCNFGSVNAKNVHIGGPGDTDHFSRLSYVGRACFNSTENEKKGLCLTGTRVDLLKDIDKWYEASNGKHIFWLSGWAGTGKSTIARTVARKFYDNKRLAASFFFSKDYGDTSSANSFATTIAYQLGDYDPRIKDSIENKLKRHPHLITQGISEQWKQLVLDPLAEVAKQSRNQDLLLLVIDALDECAGEDDISLIVNLLAQVPQVCGRQLLVFLTSRPEYSIRPELRCVEHTELKLQSIDENVVNEDIFVFISKEFKKIATKLQAGPGWPGEQDIAALVESSAGLFIWAATACRYVQLGRTKQFASDRLKDLLQGSSAESDPHKNLDKIYTNILTASIRAEWNQRERDEHHGALRKILGAIVLLHFPLSAVSLSNLIDHPEIESTLWDLHSILDIPEDSKGLIRLHHPSFRDFFLNKWMPQQEETHHLLADSCLELMTKKLKRDICQLKHPGILREEIGTSQVSQCLSSELQYACLCWVAHLGYSQSQLSDGCKTHLFLQEHFLYWIEVMALLGKAFDSVKLIIWLQSMVDANASELKDLLHDAYRFLLNSCSIIDNAPLQLYCSALLFCPSETGIKKLFEKEIPPWIILKPQVAEHWDSFHALRYINPADRVIGGKCHCLVFSPNGQYVASVVGELPDYIISIWEVSTGAPFRKFTVKQEHSAKLRIYFSWDSYYLTLGWLDRSFNELCRSTIHIYAGNWSDIPNDEQKFSEQSLVSPDGSLEASYVSPDTWHIKSIKNKETLIVLGYPYKHALLAFSPNPNQIATMDRSGECQIFDIMHSQGHKKYSLDYLSSDGFHSARHVEISQQGTYVCSYNNDYVHIWKIEKKEVLHIAKIGIKKEKRKIVYDYLALSPDEKYVSFDGKGYEIKSLTSHRNRSTWKLSNKEKPVSSAAFSTDSQHIAYGHYNGFISILQVPSGVIMHYFEAHEPKSEEKKCYVDFIAASANLVVSCAWDQHFKIWDINTASLIHSFYAWDQGCCRGIAFTPGGQNIVIGYERGNSFLWDINKSQPEPTENRYGRRIKTGMLSPSGDPVSLNVRGNWVCAAERKLIYIPDNRGHTVDMSVCDKENRVVIGSRNGFVTVIGLDGRDPYEI